MPRSNSSTSSSDLSGSDARRRTLRVLAWTLLWLVVLDGLINVLLPYPHHATHPDANPGALRQYFEYGRSIEGKIRYMVGPTIETTASVCRAGWLDDGKVRPEVPASPNHFLVAVYGQSFAEHASSAWAKLNPRITLRVVAGPSSPLSHTYSSYMLDRNHHKASVVVIGILASAMVHLDTVTGMTWNFERPSTYLYPRYFLKKGQLVQVDPPVTSLAAFRQAMGDPTRWRQVVDYIQKYDAYYDRFVFHADWLDDSVMGRLIRRAWGQRHQHRVTARYHDAQGYRQETDILSVGRAVLAAFIRQVRADGRWPLVLLLNDQGFSDHLYQALGPWLEAQKVPFVSTHTYAPAGVRKYFLPDGHFVPSVDEETARRMEKLYTRHVGMKPQ